MKTVSGKIVATTPISLSKASKVLSNFVAVDTAASQTVSAYLHRASAAFGELVQFHRDLKQARRARKDEGDGAEKHRKKRKVAGDEERESEGGLGEKKKKRRRIESER